MKTQFKFKSAAFPEYKDGEDAVNPGVYGRRLAEYLAGKLTDAGYKVLDVHPEDWGWMVELDNEQFPLWLGCASVPGEPDIFQCVIEPAKAYVRRWFERIPTVGIVSPLGDLVEELLTPVSSDLHVH